MKILFASIICLVLGVLLSTFSLLYKSSNVSSSLSSNYTSSTDKNEHVVIYEPLVTCPSRNVDNQELAIGRPYSVFFRGWPYSFLQVTAHGSSEDIGITGCEREDNYEFYPVSFLANTLVYSSITVVLYLIMKEFKNKGVKDGK